MANETTSMRALVRALPKAELHLHLEGSLSVTTLLDLALKHDVALPVEIHPDVKYQFEDLDHFIRVASLSFLVMLDADDFARTTYEMLSHSAQHGARHVEFFFSPSSHPALSYRDMVRGMTDGIARAKREFGISAFIIPSHNRMLGKASGMEFLQQVLSFRTPEVVGIGLEFAERDFPPEEYQELYAAASANNLKLTAHAGEDGPASYIHTCLTTLGCDRIDHGYHIVDDPALTAHCFEQKTWFTCCPSTTLHTTVWRDLTSPSHAIHKMLAAGLNITISTDDPGFFQTDLTCEYLSLALPLRSLAILAMNSLEASWLDEEDKRSLRQEWEQVIAQLLAQDERRTGSSICA
jgi:adenosine deaminase